MKQILFALPLLLSLDCKPACSAIDQLQTTYQVDIALISSLTGWPVSQVIDVLSKACALGGEAAVQQEIQAIETAARAAQAQAKATQ